MPTIHFLCGPSGAGKTTYARKIAHETQAIHLAIDECLKTLTFPDVQDPIFIGTMLTKYQQCGCEILARAKNLLAQSNDVVLDMATFKRTHRDSMRDWARRVESHLILYYVSASQLTRRDRVRNRNLQKGDTYSFRVPEWLFDLVEKEFEPPSADEPAILINTDHVTSK